MQELRGPAAYKQQDTVRSWRKVGRTPSHNLLWSSRGKQKQPPLGQTYPRIQTGTSRSSLQYRPITLWMGAHLLRKTAESSPLSCTNSRYSSDAEGPACAELPLSNTTAVRSACRDAAADTAACSVRAAMVTGNVLQVFLCQSLIVKNLYIILNEAWNISFTSLVFTRDGSG